MKNFSIKKMVYSSLLITLAIILTRILSLRFAIGGVEGIRIGFGSLPIIFGGIMFGPAAGGIIGAVSDVLGYFINPLGAYMPHFTFTTFLTGFIPGVLMHYVFNKKMTYLYIFISIAVGQIVSSVILVPIFLDMLFGIPYKVTVVPKILGEAVNITIYTYFIRILVKRELIDLEILKSSK